MSTDLTTTVIPDALSAVAIRAQVNLIQDVMKSVMLPDVHYGVIPGTVKPSLLKPGAEKLCLTFRLDPQYESTEHFLGDHLFVRSKCTLYHQTSGRRMGSGEGSCSTKESKYAYRKGQRLCPHCQAEAIIKGKEQYGGGWLCWKKKGGCGQTFMDGDQAIEGQNTERVANEDVADQYNTVLKMANKRSLIAAVLNVTAASDIFTQDMEDTVPPPAQPETKPKGTVLEPGVKDYEQDKAGASGTSSTTPLGGLVNHPQPASAGVEPAGAADEDPAAPYRRKIVRASTEKEAREAYDATPEPLRQDVHNCYFDTLKALGKKKK